MSLQRQGGSPKKHSGKGSARSGNTKGSTRSSSASAKRRLPASEREHQKNSQDNATNWQSARECRQGPPAQSRRGRTCSRELTERCSTAAGPTGESRRNSKTVTALPASASTFSRSSTPPQELDTLRSCWRNSCCPTSAPASAWALSDENLSRRTSSQWVGGGVRKALLFT